MKQTRKRAFKAKVALAAIVGSLAFDRSPRQKEVEHIIWSEDRQ